MWPCRSTLAGITVLPVRSTRLAPGGTASSPFRPTAVNCVSATTNAEFSMVLPSPAMSLAPSKTVTVPGGVCPHRHKDAKTSKLHRRISTSRTDHASHVGGFRAQFIEEALDDHFGGGVQ